MTATLGKIVADFATTLNLKVAVWATSATLDSATDDDGVALPTWTYFLTIDRKSANKEYIKCTLTSTALTSIQNVSRQGALTSGFARTHRKWATVEITDFAIIKKMLDLLDGATDLNASVPLKYDWTATISNDNHLATKAYVDGVAIAGGADASTTTKGISKLSYAPVSASDPIAVGDNDPRVPTTGENDALAGTSGTAPSGTNKFVDNDDTSATAVANKVARYSAGGQLPWLPSQAFFGDGSDGDVTISSNTSLTRDMYYNNLTINNGFVLSPKGYRIFVKGTLNCEWTGKIASNGWAGWVGTAAINGWPTPGGSAWAVDYSGTTLPNPTVWVTGGAGGAIAGSAGTAGTNITLNSTGQVAVAGWAGGAGDSGAGGVGGTAGAGTDSPKSPARTYQSAYNLYDLIAGTITRHQISPTGGGGGGGGGQNSWATPNGWGGGGSGATGWFITIFANIITNLNVEAIGGAGGAGGTTNLSSAGGGGGWAGGNGWFIVIFYSAKTTVTATVTGGAAGAGWVATAPATNSGAAGTAGNAWLVLQIQI